MFVFANENEERMEDNWIRFLNTNSAKLTSVTLAGETILSVFVGRYGYIKVKVGRMVPRIHGDTTILDKREMWLGKSIEEIVNYSLSLVRGVADITVYQNASHEHELTLKCFIL